MVVVICKCGMCYKVDIDDSSNLLKLKPCLLVLLWW